MSTGVAEGRSCFAWFFGATVFINKFREFILKKDAEN
jgi:hypothetical protein